MTNPSLSPQNLKEFAQNLLDDLHDGRISPDEAIIASLQYPYLREFIHARRDEVAGALQDEEKLKAVLEGALTAAAATINRELPQFQVEKPDAQLSPNDIVAMARSFRAARRDVVAATGRQQASVEQLRKTFINQLVEQWINQTRSLMENEKQKMAAGALKTELEEQLVDVSSFEEISTRVQRSLKNTLVTAGDAATIQSEVAPAQRELVTAMQKLAGFIAIPKELVLRASTPRPDWFTAIAIQTISSTALPPAAAFARAASLAQTAGALSLSLPKEKDVASTGVFFHAFASTPVQKTFAAAADALLHQLSPLARQEVIKATFSRALEGALVKTDLLTERLGREFVESEFFQMVIGEARKEFARGAGGEAGARQARGALEDIIGSVLRGPIAEPLVGSPKEAILSYFELLAIESRLPHDKKMVFPDHAPVVRALSLLSGSLTDDVRTNVIKDAGFVSLAALRNSASQLAQRLPSWQMFYIIMLASGTPLTYASFIAPMLSTTGGAVGGIVPSSVFESVGGGPAGAISGGFGAALGWAGRGLSGVAFGLGGGLIGGVFGGGLGSFFNKLRGPREPNRFFDDTPKLLAIIIVVIIVVLFVFPSFINSTLTSRVAKYAALLVSSREIAAGGPYTEEFPSYGGPFPSGPTTVSTCAVDHKKLTQIPFDSGGIGTHKNTCAYDFNAPSMSPVVATHDGCVAFVRTDIENNKKDEGSYGNVVILAGKAPDGNVFYSRYAHLAQNTSSQLSEGQCVTAGTPIGKVDNTGNSTGTHLHLEFLNENMKYITPTQCSSAFSIPDCVQ